MQPAWLVGKALGDGSLLQRAPLPAIMGALIARRAPRWKLHLAAGQTKEPGNDGLWPC
jgi:hypothetical protein